MCVHFGLTAVEMLSTAFSAGVKAEVPKGPKVYVTKYKFPRD